MFVVVLFDCVNFFFFECGVYFVYGGYKIILKFVDFRDVL